MNTESYTPRIALFSEYYRTYSNVVTFRTVTGEYLIAMKLRSGREYKFDRSDVIGILWEQEKKGNLISLERIKKAAAAPHRVEVRYESCKLVPADTAGRPGDT